MGKLENNWRQKSLGILENRDWGDTAKAPTNLVRRCIELSRVPVGNFTESDLRLMIGQNIGLKFLVPLALEKLQNDLFVEADLYEGDLLSNVLAIDTSFWNDNQSCWFKLNQLIKDKRQKLAELKIGTAKFDNAKVVVRKGSR